MRSALDGGWLTTEAVSGLATLLLYRNFLFKRQMEMCGFEIKEDTDTDKQKFKKESSPKAEMANFRMFYVNKMTCT